VQATCSRIIIVNDGKIAAADTTEKLTARLQANDRVQLSVRGPATQVVTELRKVNGVEGITHQESDGVLSLLVEVRKGAEVRDKLAASVVQHGWSLLELRQLQMSLEEIFLRVTSADSSEGRSARVPASKRAPAE
jgi:ABC-2 type transport system ATP-binding protein